MWDLTEMSSLFKAIINDYYPNLGKVLEFLW